MEAIKSLVTGKSPKTSLVIASAVIGAKVWYNSKYPVTGEETPEEKKQASIKLASVIAVVALILLPVIVQKMKQPSASSSFQARVASAASEIRESLDETSEAGFQSRVSDAVEKLKSQIEPSSSASLANEDFQSRIAAAAKKLRSEISSKTDTPSSSAALKSSSQLAAQASSEIEKFIRENS